MAAKYNLSSLEKLPVELQVKLMSCLLNGNDLCSLTSASRTYHNAFGMAKNEIGTAVVLNELATRKVDLQRAATYSVTEYILKKDHAEYARIQEAIQSYYAQKSTSDKPVVLIPEQANVLLHISSVDGLRLHRAVNGKIHSDLESQQISELEFDTVSSMHDYWVLYRRRFRGCHCRILHFTKAGLINESIVTNAEYCGLSYFSNVSDVLWEMFFTQPYRRPGKGPLVHLGKGDGRGPLDQLVRRFYAVTEGRIFRRGKAGKRDDVWQMMLDETLAEKDVRAFRDGVEAEESDDEDYKIKDVDEKETKIPGDEPEEAKTKDDEGESETEDDDEKGFGIKNKEKEPQNTDDEDEPETTSNEEKDFEIKNREKELDITDDEDEPETTSDEEEEEEQEPDTTDDDEEYPLLDEDDKPYPPEDPADILRRLPNYRDSEDYDPDLPSMKRPAAGSRKRKVVGSVPSRKRKRIVEWDRRYKKPKVGGY